MKRLMLVFAIFCLLFSSGVEAANFYWKDSFASLDAIAGKADGDRGIVITSGGEIKFYYNVSGTWTEITALPMTGTLTGGIMILDNVVSPTAAQVYGSWNTITTAGTVTLPAAATGMSTCIATEGALEITLELDGSDTFVLAGITMDAGEAIINTTAAAAGDYICVIATSAVKWRVAGKQGTWTQATP